jgi:hypothetical protein
MVSLVRQNIGFVALKVGYNKQMKREEGRDGQRETLAVRPGYTWLPAFLHGNSEAFHPGGRPKRGSGVVGGQVTGPHASPVHRKNKGLEKPGEMEEAFPSPEEAGRNNSGNPWGEGPRQKQGT